MFGTETTFADRRAKLKQKLKGNFAIKWRELELEHGINNVTKGMLDGFKIEVIASYDGMIMQSWCQANGIDDVREIIREIEDELDF